MISRDPDYLIAAVFEAQGNLTHASEMLEVSKQHIMSLARRHGLNDWAREVRISNGHPPVGNPQRSRPRI